MLRIATVVWLIDADFTSAFTWGSEEATTCCTRWGRTRVSGINRAKNADTNAICATFRRITTVAWVVDTFILAAGAFDSGKPSTTQGRARDANANAISSTVSRIAIVARIVDANFTGAFARGSQKATAWGTRWCGNTAKNQRNESKQN